MRRFIPLGVGIAILTPAFCIQARAADRTPSVVRARQLQQGGTVRSIQDADGPTLLRPTLEEPQDGGPPPTFREDSTDEPRSGTPSAADPAPGGSTAPPARGPTLPSFEPDLGTPGTLPPQYRSRTPQSTLDPRGVANASDFWVVSSRNCLQQGDRPSATCPLDYFQCGRAGRPLRSDEGSFRQSLKPGVPVCIVVHGSFTEWNTVCEDACSTYRWLRAAAPHLPLQMVFYSWPSQASTVVLPPVDVGILGVRAEFNGLYLSQLVQRLPPESPVCLMGHSHGGRAIASCLHVLAGGNVQGFRYSHPQNIPHRIRAVYVAAALDHQYLLPGERYGCGLKRAEAILNVRNCRDWALGFYEWRRPFAGNAMGRVGMTPEDRQQLGATASRIRELDVSGLLGEEHLWPAYVRRPEIATAAVPYVYFEGELSSGPGLLTPSAGAPPADGTSPQSPETSFRPSTPSGTSSYPSAPYNTKSGYPASGPVHSARSYPIPPETNPSPYRGPGGSSWPTAMPNRATQPAASWSNGTSRSPAAAPQSGSPYAGSPRTVSPYVLPPQGGPTAPPVSGDGGLRPLPPGSTAPYSATPRPSAGTPPSTKAPATLLPPQSSTAPAGRGALQPLPAPRDPYDVAPFPESEPSQPVHREEKAFEKPTNRLPSIFRRYYPEAHRPEPAADVEV